MKASLRCTTEELPDLKPPWIWIGSQDTGWIASFSAYDHPYRVEASVIGNDGIQICASVDSHAFHAPLVVILAVAMANGVDITMVTKSVAGPKA